MSPPFPAAKPPERGPEPPEAGTDLSAFPAAPPDGSRNQSYERALKSSIIIGGSSLINIGLGMVRTKAMALLLGPGGIGLMGLYNSVVDVTRSVAGLGLNNSGVRQIAQAVGTGDSRRVACTATALRRIALCSGALGAVLLLVFRKQVSVLTFHDDAHSGAIALLALAVFFGDISAAQTALVQGMRRIADLARMNVLGALYGTLLSIPIVFLYYEFGPRYGLSAKDGIVPALVCVAAMTIVSSWWYARKIRLERVRLTSREFLGESSELLKLGLVFMASGLMLFGSGLLIRVMILRQLGEDAAGFYQSAWNIGGLYIGFILQAMGADFYPRLTASAGDHPECNRLVNEQAEVGLLLAGPGVLGTLVFAPLVIDFFYSGKFGPAVETLRWICLGMLLRVGTWPIGFIVLAKGARKIFFLSELLSYVALIGLTWAGLKWVGLRGAGIAFCAMYVLNWIGVYLVVRRLTGFRWSAANRKLAAIFLPVVAVVLIGCYLLPRWLAFGFGAVTTAIVGIYSLRLLHTLVPFERLPRPVQKTFRLLRLS